MTLNPPTVMGKKEDFRTPIKTMTMEMGGVSFFGRQGVQRVFNNIFLEKKKKKNEI